MSKETVVRAYLKAMEVSDLDGVLACFTADGVINSPVYGRVPVREFSQRLFGDTVKAEVDIYCLYTGIGQADRIAAHFGYVWLKKDGTRIETDLVDLFTFNAGSDLIAELKIIFDTAAKK